MPPCAIAVYILNIDDWGIDSNIFRHYFRQTKVTSNCGTCWGPHEPGVITQGEAELRDHNTEGLWHANGKDGLSDNWVEIDLADYYKIQKVVFYNRKDWDAARAERARVILLNANR